MLSRFCWLWAHTAQLIGNSWTSLSGQLERSRNLLINRDHYPKPLGTAVAWGPLQLDAQMTWMKTPAWDSLLEMVGTRKLRSNSSYWSRPTTPRPACAHEVMNGRAFYPWGHPQINGEMIVIFFFSSNTRHVVNREQEEIFTTMVRF